MSSYYDQIVPPVGTSTPERHLGKILSSNQNDPSVVIISQLVKSRVRNANIYNLEKKKKKSVLWNVYIKNLFTVHFE